MSDSSLPEARFRPHPLLWWGLAVLLGGTGPLVATMLAAKAGWLQDPNPNPVGFGILAFLTFWPGVGMTIGGGLLSLGRWLQIRADRRRPPQRPIVLGRDPLKPS